MIHLNERITIKTERLMITEASIDDLEFFMYIEQIAENKRYEMSGVLEQTAIIEKFNKFLKGRSQIPHQGAIMFIAKLNDYPIGYISLICNWEKTKEWELGYSFLPSHFRQGYAFESILPVINFAFNELKIHKLMAFVHAGNTPSIKLLEKLKMKQEGHLREARLIDGTWADEKVFTMIENDLFNLYLT